MRVASPEVRRNSPFAWVVAIASALGLLVALTVGLGGPAGPSAEPPATKVTASPGDSDSIVLVVEREPKDGVGEFRYEINGKEFGWRGIVGQKWVSEPLEYDGQSKVELQAWGKALYESHRVRCSIYRVPAGQGLAEEYLVSQVPPPGDEQRRPFSEVARVKCVYPGSGSGGN